MFPSLHPADQRLLLPFPDPEAISLDYSPSLGTMTSFPEQLFTGLFPRLPFFDNGVAPANHLPLIGASVIKSGFLTPNSQRAAALF